jgi:ATP-dependent DNA ligase
LILTLAGKSGLADVFSRIRNSKYASGKGNDWAKKICVQREALTVAAFALDEMGGTWSAQGEYLVYVGKVDHDFDKDRAEELRTKLKPLTQPHGKRLTGRRGRRLNYLPGLRPAPSGLSHLLVRCGLPRMLRGFLSTRDQY